MGIAVGLGLVLAAHPTVAAAQGAPDAGATDESGLFDLEHGADEMLDHQAHFQTFRAFEAASREQMLQATGATPVQLDAFGDVSAQGDFGGAGPARGRFVLGPLGLMFMAALGPHVDFMAETALEADESNDLSIDLERLSLRWSAKHFSVMAGRMHTDLGFWNATYHHGRWLQPTIRRPRVVGFEDEGGLIPAHAVGVAGEAIIGVGPGDLHVVLTVANGRGDVPDEILLVRDTNLAKQVVLSVYHDQVGVRGLRLGVSFDVDHIAPAPGSLRPALPDEAIDEAIGNVNLALLHAPVTLIAESFVFVHRARSQTWRIFDSYVVAGWQLGSFQPYLEVEDRRSPDGLPPFFQAASVEVLPNFTRGLVGLRYDTTRWSALRLEYSLDARTGASSPPQSVQLNWSFGL